MYIITKFSFIAINLMCTGCQLSVDSARMADDATVMHQMVHVWLDLVGNKRPLCLNSGRSSIQ